MKKQYVGGNCLKRGVEQFKGGGGVGGLGGGGGGWQKRWGGVFDEGLIPQCTLWSPSTLLHSTAILHSGVNYKMEGFIASSVKILRLM